MRYRLLLLNMGFVESRKKTRYTLKHNGLTYVLDIHLGFLNKLLHIYTSKRISRIFWWRKREDPILIGWICDDEKVEVSYCKGVPDCQEMDLSEILINNFSDVIRDKKLSDILNN